MSNNNNNNNNSDNKDDIHIPVKNKIVKKVIDYDSFKSVDCPWPQIDKIEFETKPFYNRPDFMADCPWPSSSSSSFKK
jgi:hypothetical protein